MKELILDQVGMSFDFAAAMEELSNADIGFNDILDLGSSNMGFGVIPEKKSCTVLMWANLEEKMMKKIYTQIEKKGGEVRERTNLEFGGQKIIYLTGGRDGSHVMISRIGKRLILAVCNKTGTEEVNNTQLKAIIKKNFARFIKAQKGNGGGFVKAKRNKPGIAAARPKGNVVFEGYIDIEKILNSSQVRAGSPDLIKKIFDFGSLKALSVQKSFDGKNLNSSLFLSCPKPRAGILAIFDQPKIPVTPPNWVPTNVKSYSHLSLDFMRLFKFVKTIAAEEVGESAIDEQVAELDITMRAFLQISLKGVIDSIGKQVYMVDFGGNGRAIVMKFKSPVFMAMAFEMLSPLIEKRGIVKSKIQDFNGFTLKRDEENISLFYGKNHLVFTTEKETLNRVISLISNPPKGEAALATSDKFQAFLAKENLSKSIAFSYGGGILQALALADIAKESIFDPIDRAEKCFVKAVLDLLSTEVDLTDMFGLLHDEIKKSAAGYTIKSKTVLFK